MINSQRLASREERADFDEVQGEEEGHQARGIQENCEQDLQGGEVSDGEHLCRGLIALGVVLIGSHRAGSNGVLPECSRAAGHFSCSVAVTEQRPDRHHPSRSLQSLRQARDEDRMATSLNEPIIQSQLRLEHGPADRQHFLAVRVHPRIGIRQRDFAFVPRAGPRVSTGALRFRLAVSDEMRQFG